MKEKVKQILQQLAIADPQVKILEESGSRVLAEVVSSSFEGMDQGERQRLVWSKLLDELGDDQSRWVEFVFTDAPSEIAAAEAAEAG
jgi:acid stress-induced BolA-like protein IbaG/YrbA